MVGISKQVQRCYWCQCWGRGDSFSFLSCWLFHLHWWTVRIKGLVLGLCPWAISLTPKEAGRGWWPFGPLTFLMSPFPTSPTLKLTLFLPLLNLKTSALHTGVFLVTVCFLALIKSHYLINSDWAYQNLSDLRSSSRYLPYLFWGFSF